MAREPAEEAGVHSTDSQVSNRFLVLLVLFLLFARVMTKGNCLLRLEKVNAKIRGD